MPSLRSKIAYHVLLRAKNRKPDLEIASLSDHRNDYSKSKHRFLPKPSHVYIEQTEIEQVKVVWFRPEHPLEDKLVVYVHGGGFVFNNQLHRLSTARIAKGASVNVVSIEYSLAPEHPYPTALDEIQRVYHALLRMYKASNIVFAGDSAGGNLVICSLIMMRDQGIALPAAAIAVSPPTDATFSGKSITEREVIDPLLSQQALYFFCDAYRADYDANEPLISPLFANLEGLPPLLLQIGENEILYDDSIRFAEKARAAGVSVTLSIGAQMMHVWYMLAPLVPESTTALREITDFITKYLQQ
jgi:monoterpene epsilon-lactone hydrolase